VKVPNTRLLIAYLHFVRNLKTQSYHYNLWENKSHLKFHEEKRREMSYVTEKGKTVNK